MQGDKSSEPASVLVLGGGPDAEREVSLVSSKAVAAALVHAGHTVNYQVIDRPTLRELKNWAGDVVFPVLHGGWGEGGPLQDLLEQLGRPYVGCRPQAARMAMDKLGTKLTAASIGVRTAPAGSFNPRDEGCPLGPVSAAAPVVLKPVHEGSSVGVHICRDARQWADAVEATREDMRRHPDRAYMVERGILGSKELTVGVLGNHDGSAEPLDPILIAPAVEFYDYQAKYHRNDTSYTVDAPLPTGVKEQVQRWAGEMFRALGCRHLARVDFLMDAAGLCWLLEVNTMPGFTDHSLLPMAAAHRGRPMPSLCSHLVSLAASERR